MGETIGEAWVSYRQKVLPVDASRVQVSETKRAFYAGAFAMQGLFLANVGRDDEDENAAQRWLQARTDEAMQFRNRVERGLE